MSFARLSREALCDAAKEHGARALEFLAGGFYADARRSFGYARSATNTLIPDQECDVVSHVTVSEASNETLRDELKRGAIKEGDKQAARFLNMRPLPSPRKQTSART